MPPKKPLACGTRGTPHPTKVVSCANTVYIPPWLGGSGSYRTNSPTLVPFPLAPVHSIFKPIYIQYLDASESRNTTRVPRFSSPNDCISSPSRSEAPPRASFVVLSLSTTRHEFVTDWPDILPINVNPIPIRADAILARIPTCKINW